MGNASGLVSEQDRDAKAVERGRDVTSAVQELCWKSLGQMDEYASLKDN